MSGEIVTRSIRIRKRLYDELLSEAKKENRTFNNMVETILLAHCQSNASPMMQFHKAYPNGAKTEEVAEACRLLGKLFELEKRL